MPSIADLQVSVSPRDDPLTYPGTVLRTSYLWLDRWMYHLAPAPRAGLGGWQLTVDGGPLGGPDPTPVPLDAALAAARVAAIAQRHPVLAYGSNAAPAQLLDKFSWFAPVDRVIPVTAGRVRGFALAHSAHVSNPGYIPFVLVAAGRAAELAVQVLWLAADQLAALNETEPNYALVPVNGDRHPLTLASGEVVSRFSAYRGMWGALRRPGEHGPAAAAAQGIVHGELARADWFAGLVGRVGLAAQIRRLSEDRTLRDRVRDELAARGWTVADGWDG